MEERRFQVFVSSTFLDLKEERAAVVSALLQLEAMPAGMELFPAADEDAWSLIERVIETSDYYLLVIGGKYGSVDPDAEISYTEKEYDFAISRKKPVMAFLHANPEDIPLGKSEKDAATREKLTAFREKVKKKKHVKYWSNPDDLAGKVALSYANFRRTYPAVGWMRGDAQASTEALSELNELRKELERTRERLQTARSAPPPGTERLAQGNDEAQLVVTGAATLSTERSSAFFSESETYRERFLVEPTWDQLFASVGPSMLVEAEEGALRSTLNRWLTERHGHEVRRDAQAYAAESDKDLKYISGVSVQLTDEAFGTLIVQLRALGLISRSDRKRSVTDKGTYWALTPYGDQHLTTLRAISRDGTSFLEPTDRERDQDKSDDIGGEGDTAHS